MHLGQNHESESGLGNAGYNGEEIKKTFLWMNTVTLRIFYAADVLDIGQLDG